MDYRISERMKNARGSIIRDLLKLANEPGMISLGGGSPAPSTFPSADIARIAGDIYASNPAAMLKYSESEGYAPLRQTMKEFFAQRENITFDDNELFILSGGQQCADLTSKVLVNEGDTVITEEPSFVGCMNAFRSYGAKLHGVPMDADGVNIDLLEKAFGQENISFFYIIPTFQNPTGTTTSLKKREQIYALAQEYGVLIFEDNPYGELRFEGEWIPPIKSMDRDGRVIYAGSFSKTMAPGFRLAPIVMPKGLADRFKVAKQASDVHTGTLYQYITNEFLHHSDYDQHIASARSLYKQKCGVMLEEIRKAFHPAVTSTHPQGGLFVMLVFPQGFDTLPFVREGIKRKVISVPGSAFMPDPDQPCNLVRLNYSLPSEEQIIQGIRILGKLSYEMLG